MPEGKMQKIATRNQEPATRNQEPDSGFTLLEIMVALSIIAIVLVSVYKMQAQTISMNYAARFYATAPLLAQLKIAEVEIENFREPADDSGDFGDEFPGYRWNVVIDDIDSELLGNIAENLKKIDVNVSFNTDEFTYSLRTYRFIQK
ncbi:MAG: prepilin-type N-terminal cleavage/methylation domain-containing protein [Thermodesulfobacteriota bacterium]|nr:prepilin-type N-terminal cleavage/methylation domain-containing protein [Thermodesulfobacteriota bacterium]